MPYARKTARTTVRRRPRSTRRPAQGLRTTIKKTLLGLAETKSHHFDVSHDCYDNLTHWVTSNALQLPAQGVGGHQRIGNSVQSKGIMLRGMINLDSTNTTSQFTVKVFVVSATQSAMGTPNTIYRNVIGNAMIDPINSKIYKVLKVKTLKPPPLLIPQTSGNTSRYPDQMYKCWIPTNKTIQYHSAAGLHNNNQIGIVVVAYSNGIVTQVLCENLISIEHFYKDI
jgi:hypothetical protein